MQRVKAIFREKILDVSTRQGGRLYGDEIVIMTTVSHMWLLYTYVVYDKVFTL